MNEIKSEAGISPVISTAGLAGAEPTGLEYTRRGPGRPATINGKAIPFWDKKQAVVAAKILRVPQRCVQRVETRFDAGWAIWFGNRFLTRPEWIAAAAERGIDLRDNNWHKTDNTE